MDRSMFQMVVILVVVLLVVITKGPMDPRGSSPSAGHPGPQPTYVEAGLSLR